MPSLETRYVLSYVCRAYPDKMSPNTRIYITYQYRAARSLPPELFSFTFHCLFVVVVAVTVVVVVGSYKFYRNLCAISWFFMCAFGCGRFKCVCLFPTTDFKWKWKWKESKRTFNLEMQHRGIFTCNFDCSSLFSFSPFFLFLFAEFPLFAFFVNSNFKTHFHYQLNTTRQITELFVLIGTAAEKNKYSEISNWIVYLVCQCIWDSQIWCDIAREQKKR